MTEDDGEEQDVEAAAVDLPTGDALKRKLIAIVDEFAETKDVAEATACFEELRGSDELSAALARLGTSTLDKDPKFRAGIAKLWDLAVSLQLLAPSDLVKELGVVAPSLDDTAVDVPKIAAYFAELVTPSLLSGSLSLTDFASACAEGRGLSAVSLAQAIVAVRAANAEAPEVTSPGVASALFACVAPGRYSPVVNALGASAALFPALPAVAASRQALQRHSDVEALLALHAGVDPAVSRTADYAKLLVSDVCHYAFVAAAAEDVGELPAVLEPFARLLLRVVSDAGVESTQAASAVLDGVHALATADPAKGLLVALLKFLVESNVIKASAFEEWLGQREASGEPLSEEVTALRAILPK